MKNVLITGGAGYIGSHIAVELLEKGYNVSLYDNLSNSSKLAVKRVAEITGKSPNFYEADILDKRLKGKTLEEIGEDYQVTRERIRQKERNLKKIIPYKEIFEWKYAEFFEKYELCVFTYSYASFFIL